MTISITEFITARLDSDEAHARNAFKPHGDEGPKNGPEWREIWSGTVECGPGGEHIATFDSQLSRHIERHDPARVLREVAAKRAILRDHLEDHAADHDYANHLMSLRDGYSGCYTVGQLATVWADHPDYNPDWGTT